MALIKTPAEIEKLRRSGKILSEVLGALAKEAKEGVSLKFFESLARQLIAAAGSRPAFLGYRPRGAKKGFPASICASVNEVIVHAIPSRYKLKNGDILKLDAGVNYEGWNSDAAITIGIGKISPLGEKLISATKRALEAAISVARPGNTLGDIGYMVKQTVSRAGFHVVKGLTGHGIGKEVHEEPSVLNEGRKGEGFKLEAGMVLAIEPMVAVGTPDLILKKDGSYAASDGSLTAHFEHTIVITKSGAEILTAE